MVVQVHLGVPAPMIVTVTNQAFNLGMLVQLQLGVPTALRPLEGRAVCKTVSIAAGVRISITPPDLVVYRQDTGLSHRGTGFDSLRGYLWAVLRLRR